MKFIEFTTTMGQRALVNRDWIAFVRETKQGYTTIYLGVESKNMDPLPLNVIGDYNTIIKLITEE